MQNGIPAMLYYLMFIIFLINESFVTFKNRRKFTKDYLFLRLFLIVINGVLISTFYVYGYSLISAIKMLMVQVLLLASFIKITPQNYRYLLNR